MMRRNWVRVYALARRIALAVWRISHAYQGCDKASYLYSRNISFQSPSLCSEASSDVGTNLTILASALG